MGRPDFDGVLRELPPGCAVYSCGPAPMLPAVEECCEKWVEPGMLHVERFSATPPS